MRLLLAITIAAALSGCANVKPWERGYLAKPEMALDGDKAEARFYQHIYTSKEAARGGYGAGGGGCGCN